MPRGRYQPVFAGLLLFRISVGKTLSLTKSTAQYDMTLRITNHQHTGTLQLKFTFMS